ncbi:Rho GTPase activating protein, partial [Coemansia spiralis]
MHGLHDATHQSPVARPPAGMALPGGHALPGDGSDLDGDLDIILIMQERDAYKKETEKLRQIVDRQRFIIKSLQDQFARVQGASAASTPSARQHGLSPEQPAQYQYQHQHGSESADPPHDAPAARNALGLSSLEVSSLPTATPPERKASQGSQLGDLPTRAPDAAAAGQPETHGSARPWAKSTRLSEIYADYSARHNSVAPMFKTSPAAWAADADGSATHRQPLSEPQPGGSSFVESLKTSTARSELLAEWGVMPADSDHSDLSSEGRVSSLALESSRNPSASIDIGEREGLRANALGLQGHIPTVPSPTRSLDPADRPGAVGGTADPVGAEADQGASMASPASEAASEDLVLRPVSLIANNHAAPEQPRQRDTPLSAGLADERSQWRASRVAAYEYRALDMGTLDDFGDGSGYAKPTGQSPRPPAQQEQPWRPPSSDSLGSDHDSGPAVRWAADLSTPAQPAASASPYEQHASRARADSSQPSEGGSIAQTSISSSSARPKSDGRSDQGAALALQGPSSVYSTASTARGIPTGPPLTSLHNIDVQIKDSRVKIDERGKEVNVYMIDVVWRREITGLSLQEILAESQQAEVVLWTVEKRYSDFLNLNGQLRHVIHRERLLEKLERLPDKDIFRPNAPSKSDKRKLWFERYLRRALSLGFVDKRPLLEFLSSDQTMEPEKKMPILLGHKEGFLVKKGKNFGGWKRRYYVCKSNKPVLEYSETPGGAIIGTINLSGATVKTGKARAEDLALALARPKGLSKETDMFRHA